MKEIISKIIQNKAEKERKKRNQGQMGKIEHTQNTNRKTVNS